MLLLHVQEVHPTVLVSPVTHAAEMCVRYVSCDMFHKRRLSCFQALFVGQMIITIILKSLYKIFRLSHDSPSPSEGPTARRVRAEMCLLFLAMDLSRSRTAFASFSLLATTVAVGKRNKGVR